MSVLNKLHVSEVVDDGWYLSFGRPEFQGGTSIKIDEEIARELLEIQKA